MTDDDLTRLERLRAEGTQGEWAVDGEALSFDRGYAAEIGVRGLYVAAIHYGPGLDAKEYHRARHDLALIVAAVNALPGLIAEVRALRKVAEAVEREQSEMECLGEDFCSRAIDDDGGPSGPTSHSHRCPREVAARLRSILAAARKRGPR